MLTYIIIKDLFHLFNKEVRLTGEQLNAIDLYLNGDTNQPLVDDDDELTDLLSYFKDTMKELELVSISDLLVHFKKRKVKYTKFLYEVVTDCSSEQNFAPEEPDSLAIPFINDVLIYTTYHEYITRLSSLYRKSIFSKVKNILKQHRQVSIPGYVDYSQYSSCSAFHSIKSQTILKRYIQEFIGEQSISEVLVWQLPPQLKDSQLQMINSIQDSFACMSLVSPKVRRKFIEDIYQAVAQVIRREETITDNYTKEQIAELVYYTKLRNTINLSTCVNGFNSIEASNTEITMSEGRQLIKKKQLSKITVLMRKWRILKSKPGLSWITSDNPGFAIHLSDLYSTDGQFRALDNLFNVKKDSVIYYPLSSEYCLRIEADFGHHYNASPANNEIEYEYASTEEINVVNGLTVSTKRKMFISKDKESIDQLELANY